MEVINLVIHSSLFKLFIGVVIAVGLRIYMKRNGKPTHEDMLEELRTLLPPAVLVFAGYMAMSGSWQESLEAFLSAIAVPLGISKKREEEK